MTTPISSRSSSLSTASSTPSPPPAYTAPASEAGDHDLEHTEKTHFPEKERDPETYPSPPTSDDHAPTGDTSPATTKDQRDQSSTNMPSTPKDFYPASAYGPQGPKGYATTSQATQGSLVMGASGQSNDSNGSPGDHKEGHASKRTSQFFSEPPMPVYHNQPQSAASYYPAPHHQAQLLAQGRNSSSRSLGGTSQPTTIDPHLQPGENASENSSTQFVQGGIIYTPSVEELGLHSLSDGPPGEKPPYPYPTIIRCAILGSPRQRLTLSEIYTAMENRYPWFRTAGQGWKNSVRHNLSLNKCFAKVSRPITEPGKGAYWTVDLDAGEGNKRPRKRNKKPKKAQTVTDEVEDEDEEDFTGSEVSRSFSPEASVPRDRPSFNSNQCYDRPTYSYPPPPPPPAGINSGQSSNSSSSRPGLLTAASLGGNPRRLPLGPVGPIGEGRSRVEDDDYSD